MRKMIFFLILLIFSGCSVMQKNSFSKLDKNETIAILPFKNLSQTPYAGIKASLMAEGVLRSRGYKVVRDYNIINDKAVLKDINASYYLSGRVIEWKYKTGIDGEPAVSVYVELKDKKGDVIFSSVASRSDSGYRSLGVCAERLFEGIF